MSTGRIAIVFEGTRGDCQPYCIAGRALHSAGFAVFLAGSTDTEPMAKHFGLQFAACFPAAKEIYTTPTMVESFTNNDVQKMTKAAEDAKRGTEFESARALHGALQDFKPDLVLASSVCLQQVLCHCNALSLPLCLLSMQDLRMSRHVGAFGVLPTLPAWTGLNLPAWWLFLKMWYTGMCKEPNRKAAMEVATGLPEDKFWPSFAEFVDCMSASRAPFPVLLATSRALNGPLPPDYSAAHRVLGPLTPRPEDETGPAFGSPHVAELEDFLMAGEPPVYMGFGSIICHSSKHMTLLCLRALRLTDRRAVLCAGWAGLSLEDLSGEPDAEALRALCTQRVLLVETAPHGTLFPRCAAIVHHGGAGTLNASLRSGRPTVVAPIILDQFAHSELVNTRGVGVGMPSLKKATPEMLAHAIRKCLDSPEIQRAAQALADELNAEDGQRCLVEQVSFYMQDSVRSGKHAADYQRWRKQHADKRNSCCVPKVRMELPPEGLQAPHLLGARGYQPLEEMSKMC